MVDGGRVDVEVVVSKMDSVVVIAGAVCVTEVTTGVDAVTVRVGSSGARSSRGAATAFALRSRLSLAASIRLRAYS